jgi:hypothetical protein
MVASGLGVKMPSGAWEAGRLMLPWPVARSIILTGRELCKKLHYQIHLNGRQRLGCEVAQEAVVTAT